MLTAFPQVNGDALIYGGIAKNILLHGQFAITDGSGHSPDPDSPAWLPTVLAACFRLFGVANYSAVAYLQIALEILPVCCSPTSFAVSVRREPA